MQRLIYNSFSLHAKHRNICGANKFSTLRPDRQLGKFDDFSKPVLSPELQVLVPHSMDVKLKTTDVIPGRGPPPEKPADCCMSGCPNCVWVTYAEELLHYYRPLGKRKVREAINNIDDQNLRGFLEMELARELRDDD